MTQQTTHPTYTCNDEEQAYYSDYEDIDNENGCYGQSIYLDTLNSQEGGD